MNRYHATNASTAEVLDYDADAPLPAHLSPPWKCAQVFVAVPGPADPPPPPPVFEWIPLDFMRRFTMQERMACRAAEKTDPVVADLFDLLRTAPTIHSTDPDVLRGLGYLTQQGLIADGRSAIILGGA